MAVLSAFGPEPSGVFYTGAATSPSDIVPGRYPVAIAGHPYNIEPRLYSRRFIPIQRDARMDETEPGEVALSPAGIWRRSQSDWGLGAGQEFLDDVDSDRRRFHESLGIDVFITEADEAHVHGGLRRFCLLNDTEEKRDSANTNLRILRAGSYVYIVDGASVLFSDGAGSEQAATWSFTAATGLVGTADVLDIATSGSHVYVLDSDNSIYRATLGTTAFSLFYNPTATMTRIWAGLGRLFASDGEKLYEITATPGETEILDHPDPNYVVSHVSAAPTGIYIAGNIGQFGEVRHSWIRDDGTTWVPPVVAAEFINEPVNVCASAGQIILIGTERGVRFSTIDGATTGLDFGPVIPVGEVHKIIFDSVGAEIFAWFTWSDITSGNSGLGRLRLARFTEARVPAYASDIYTVDGGTVIDAASIGGRRYFATSGGGFYGANANKVASGTLSTGRIRYGLLDEKVFSSVHWRTDPLEGGSVNVTVSYDDGATIGPIPQTSANSVQSGEVSVGPRRGEWAEITFTLTRDSTDTTLGPCVRWWHMRSLPAPESVIEFLVPLRLFAKEKTPQGPLQPVNTLAEVDFLQQLMMSQSVVTYQEGTSSYKVHLANLEFGGASSGHWNWVDHRLEGICMVQMLSLGI